MARNIRGNYFEDNYLKYECQGCKRSFIVGEKLSENMNLVCPYCSSGHIEWRASATEEATEDMDLGCLGIHFSVYDDGQLMLYTEREFAHAMPDIGPNFTVEDINKIREWNDQRRKDMSRQEIIEDIERGANEFAKLVEASRKTRKNNL